MDVPRTFSVSRLSTTLPRSLHAETPQKSIKWEHRNGSMILSASISSTVLHLRLLDGPIIIITYHLPPLALESQPTKTSPRIVHQDSHIMFRLPSQQPGKAGLSERFQCRFASSDTARALLDLLRPYFTFHAKSGPSPSQESKGPSNISDSSSLPPPQSALATSSKFGSMAPSTDLPAGTITPTKQPALPASPVLVNIMAPPVQTTFPPTPVSKPNGRVPSSNLSQNSGSQQAQPRPVLATQKQPGSDHAVIDDVALKKALLKGYSAPSRSIFHVNPDLRVDSLNATSVGPPTTGRSSIHTPISVPERTRTPHNSQSQGSQSLSRDPFAQALWNDPAVVRSFSEIPISADSDIHMSASASASQPTQIAPINKQDPPSLISGTPMEVELISLDSPRLADAVLPVSASQNELEGIRIDPDPLWDEEGEAYAGWTQVDSRFPPLSKFEADEKMDEGEDREEDYEPLHYRSQGDVPFSIDSRSSHELSSGVLPARLYRPGESIYALDEVQLESLICEVVLEAGFEELVERVANILESRLASQELQLQDQDDRSSSASHPSRHQHGWPDHQAIQYFAQPQRNDLDLDRDLGHNDWRGYLPPADVQPGWSEPRWSGFKDMDIDEDLDDDFELEFDSH